MASFIPNSYKRYWLNDADLWVDFPLYPAAGLITPDTPGGLRVALCTAVGTAVTTTFLSDCTQAPDANLVTPAASTIGTNAVFGIPDQPLTFVGLTPGDGIAAGAEISHVVIVWWGTSAANSPVLVVTDQFASVLTNDNDIEVTFAQTDPKVFAA